MTTQYFTSFSTLVPREVYKAGLLTENQRVDLFRYFADVHARWLGGEQYPYDLEELVPTVFSTKSNAVKKLLGDYKKDEDYQALIQMDYSGEINDLRTSTPDGRVPTKYHLTCECFEHMVAKRNKAVFAVYSQIFHATVEERRAQLTPRVGDVRALLYAAKALNLAPSAQLGILTQYFNRFPLTENLLPAYAVDAPLQLGGPAESSEATASATQLLKERNSSFQAKTLYRLMEKEGLLDRLTRPSTTQGTKEFWNVTQKGLEFGKNLSCPKNPRETQPHWYRNTFDGLLNRLGANC